MQEMTFKAELTAYRKQIEIGPDDETRAFLLKILGRWEKHIDNWEDLWERLGSILLLRQPPGVFIAGVLLSRLNLERALSVHSKSPGEKLAATRTINSQWDAPGGDFFAAASMKEKLRNAQYAYDQMDRALGREKKSAQRRKFVELWSDHFREHCATPAHEIVAALTEIAFGRKFDVTDVRDALKFRQRRDRDTRKQNSA